MRFLSVCSGIEAASVAWKPLGWECAGVAEIEKFPSMVLAHHYPEVKNYGDITKFREWPDMAFDVLIGGTPCQSFSVAGLRAGLRDPRGNLALVFLGIAQRYKPRWIVWENVPGVLSSSGGRDFGCFLGGLGQCGYGFAYAVLDAQYFGLAQRRKRVFVIGHSGGCWQRSAAVLFDTQSLRRNSAPRQKEREGIAPTLEGRARRSGETNFHTSGGLAPTLNARTKGGGGLGTDAELGGCCIATTLPAGGNSTGGHRPPGTGQETAATYLLPVNQAAVRRLTPTECEKLQGFPPGYTRISEKTADGPRYKALGNSMAVPVIRWLGERINLVDSIISTCGSQGFSLKG